MGAVCVGGEEMLEEVGVALAERTSVQLPEGCEKCTVRFHVKCRSNSRWNLEYLALGGGDSERRLESLNGTPPSRAECIRLRNQSI